MIKLTVTVNHTSGLLRLRNKGRGANTQKWRKKDVTYSLTVLLVSSKQSRFIDLRSIKYVA